MVPDCPMHDQCFTRFIEFLSTTAEHIRTGEITPEMVNIYEEKITELQSRGKFTGCTTCIGDMAALFKKQLDLMRSLGIYRQEKAKEAAITDIPGEVVVREIFEPIGNVQRFQMLKSLGTGTRSFSDLSRLTGLQGREPPLSHPETDRERDGTSAPRTWRLYHHRPGVSDSAGCRSPI